MVRSHLFPQTEAWCNGSIAVSKTVDGSSNLSAPADWKHGRAVDGGTPLRCWTPQGVPEVQILLLPRQNGRLAELVDGAGPENRKTPKGLVGSNPTSSAHDARVAKMVNVSVRKTDIRGFESLSELNASLAQLVEHLFCKQTVAGSIPVGGSRKSCKFAPEKAA